jgi:hypothetical protein
MRNGTLLWCGGLLFAACASTGPSSGSLRRSGYCEIAEAQLQGAPSAFDRVTTLEMIAGLRSSTEADRDLLKRGEASEVGQQLSQLNYTQRSQGFISSGVAELAVRLRQLDCAVRARRVGNAEAIKRYEQILLELGAEEATLKPSGGQPRAVAP